MPYLQELIPSLRFDRWDYLRALRALLPRGLLWRIPLPDERDIRPLSILSLEAFGRITVFSGIVFITPDGIGSSEAFGVPGVNQEQFIEPVGIGTMEAFGTPTVLSNFGISPNSIVSAEAFGSLTITQGFYLYDNFESGISGSWNSAFSSVPANWTTRTQQGQGIAYSPNASVSALFPQGSTVISGNFQVKFQMVIGSNSGGNVSLHIQVKEVATGNLRGNLYFVPDNLYFYDHVTAKGEQSGFTPPKIVTCKIVRTSGVIWCYYNNDAAGGEAGSWIRNDSWSTPGSSISFSGNCTLEIDGDDGYGGYGMIEVQGDLLV